MCGLLFGTWKVAWLKLRGWFHDLDSYQPDTDTGTETGNVDTFDGATAVLALGCRDAASGCCRCFDLVRTAT